MRAHTRACVYVCVCACACVCAGTHVHVHVGFFCFLFFCVPQLYLWGSPLLGEIFAYVTVF